MPAKAAKTKMVAGKLVSAKSKTGSNECSRAVSIWVLGRKSGTVAAAVYQTLAKCRAMARQNRQAELKQHAGKLAAGRGTWQRSEKAKELAKERAKRIAERTLKEKRAKELNPKPKTKVTPAKKAAPKPTQPKPKATTPKPKPPADPVVAARADIARAHDEQRRKNAGSMKAMLPEYAARLRRNPDLIPPGRIQDRLKEYTVGDVKLAAIERLGAEHDEARAEYERHSAEHTRGLQDLHDRHTRAWAELTLAKGAEKTARRKEIEAIQKETIAHNLRYHEHVEAYGKARKQLHADVTRLIAPHGPTLGITIASAPDVHPQASARAMEASTWISSVTAAAGTPRIQVNVVHGTYYGPNRAYYDPTARATGVHADTPLRTHIHEQAHAFEHQAGLGSSRQVQDIGIEFRNYRVGNEPTEQLKKLFPGSNYEDWERGSKDDFEKTFGEGLARYVGKDTLGGRTNEIVSMGIEHFHADPVGFTRKDPEFARLILGLLDGSLR